MDDNGESQGNSITSKHSVVFSNKLLDQCNLQELVGNGICNDESNIKDCAYDGGDCCSEHGILVLCKECTCTHTVEWPVPLEEQCKFYTLVANGICNDEANTEVCFFDGGDCCLLTVDDSACEDCLCVYDDSVHNDIEVEQEDGISRSKIAIAFPFALYL